MVVYSDNKILFSSKKKWTIKPQKDMEETSMHVTMWKMPIWKGYIVYSNRMTSWKGKTMKTIGRSVAARVQGGGKAE